MYYKMDCIFSKKKGQLKMKIVDLNNDDEKFSFLLTNGKFVLRMDNVYDVPKIEALFDNWCANNTRLWPKTEKAHQYFLKTERTPINSIVNSLSENCSISLDKIH